MNMNKSMLFSLKLELSGPPLVVHYIDIVPGFMIQLGALACQSFFYMIHERGKFISKYFQ